jgi:hypothetical protein
MRYGIRREDGTVYSDPSWTAVADVIREHRAYREDRRITDTLVVLIDGQWVTHDPQAHHASGQRGATP